MNNFPSMLVKFWFQRRPDSVDKSTRQSPTDGLSRAKLQSRYIAKLWVLKSFYLWIQLLNFDQTKPNFTILNNLHNSDQISRFIPNFEQYRHERKLGWYRQCVQYTHIPQSKIQTFKAVSQFLRCFLFYRHFARKGSFSLESWKFWPIFELCKFV